MVILKPTIFDCATVWVYIVTKLTHHLYIIDERSHMILTLLTTHTTYH